MKPCTNFPLVAWFVLVFIGLSPALHAEKTPGDVVPEENSPALQYEPTKQRKCRIIVTLFLKAGPSEESVFYTNAKSKKECEKQAEVHRTNFTPQLVKRKTVRVEWNHP